MGKQLNEDIREILANQLEESAMDGVSSAILKLISDRFVKKELYKEKLAEFDSLNEALKTAKEQASTAAIRLNEYENDERRRTEEESLKRRDSAWYNALETGGVNPQYVKLLIHELKLAHEQYSAENNETEFGYLADSVKNLQASYPFAFGEMTTEKAAVAITPIRNKGEMNPWSKENLDLEEQTRIFRSNPSIAREMALSAGIRLN